MDIWGGGGDHLICQPVQCWLSWGIRMASKRSPTMLAISKKTDTEGLNFKPTHDHKCTRLTFVSNVHSVQQHYCSEQNYTICLLLNFAIFFSVVHWMSALPLLLSIMSLQVQPATHNILRKQWQHVIWFHGNPTADITLHMITVKHPRINMDKLCIWPAGKK